nr:ribonuclease H-like domain-containing protein [Tanacetum cinerariifolium]
MDNDVGITSPKSTIQTLPSLEEYKLPVTYLEEVKKTLGTPIEVEPLNKTKLEEVGLNFNHITPLSSKEVPSFDKPEPQPQPLPNCPPLDASLEIEGDLKPPIKPQSPDSFRMKVLDNLTIHTPPSSLVVSFHLMDLYCYYRPCIDDLKKHFRFKPGLLGHSGSLGVDFSKLEMIDDDWGLESKEVYFIGRGFNSPIWPNEVEKVWVKETHHLEHIIQQLIFQHETPSHNNALGWRLKEIHVTWAHLEKKQTRLQTCTKIHQEVLFSERGDGVAIIKRRHRDLFGDGVWILAMASQRSRLKVDLEPSTWRWR